MGSLQALLAVSLCDCISRWMRTLAPHQSPGDAVWAAVAQMADWEVAESAITILIMALCGY